MKKRVEKILDVLIEEIEKGENIDTCLEKYPEYAEELKPLLLLAAGIEESPRPEIDPVAFKRTMAKINSLEEQDNVRNPFFLLRAIILRPVVLKTVPIVLAFTFLLSMTFSFSADSLPGDFLYPVKCFCEKARLAMTLGNEDRVELHLKLAERKTEDFMRTFKKEEQINKELLNGMLDETSNALRYCSFVSSDRCHALALKVKDCSQSQINALRVVKSLVDDSACSFVDEAIRECFLRCSCVDSCFRSGDCRCGELRSH
jgi:hypothetical protein